uniref:Uncharacterized protein n=1 Tax=Anguilla anguilla TaxID=7936 RepID=A0A0E9SFQ1_ANGAN
MGTEVHWVTTEATLTDRCGCLPGHHATWYL